MCCGKGKSQNGNGGAQLRSFSLSDNGSGLISGEIQTSSFLVYQKPQQLNFWGLTEKGEAKRRYIAKGIGTCIEVDSRDVKYLLSLKRNKTPYFIQDHNGNCQKTNQEEKPVSYGVYEDLGYEMSSGSLSSGDILHVGEGLTVEDTGNIGIGFPTETNLHITGAILEDYVDTSNVLSQEEIKENPLEGETLQEDMYPNPVGSPEILEQEELVKSHSLQPLDNPLNQLIEEIETTEPVITKTRKQRTKNA